MKILHELNQLEKGGAERVVASIIRHDKDNKHLVFSYKDGPMRPILEAAGAEIVMDDETNCAVNSTDTANGTSWASDVMPIIDNNCAISGCHNGDNSSIPNWTVFSNVQANASNIKTRTGNKTMPRTGSLTDAEIELIACWVDDGALDN